MKIKKKMLNKTKPPYVGNAVIQYNVGYADGVISNSKSVTQCGYNDNLHCTLYIIIIYNTFTCNLYLHNTNLYYGLKSSKYMLNVKISDEILYTLYTL